MHNIKINLDCHEALHTMKALLEAASKLNYQAQSLEGDEAFLAADQARVLEGVAKQLSKAAWKEGVKAPFAFFRVDEGNTLTEEEKRANPLLSLTNRNDTP